MPDFNLKGISAILLISFPTALICLIQLIGSDKNTEFMSVVMKINNDL